MIRKRHALAFACLAAGAVLLANAAYIPAKAALAQFLLERAWAQSQENGTARKPWGWADMAPIAELSVPHLDRRMIVLGDASGQAMAFAPGHMANTPMIGEPGTAIIAAHRDTHFRILKELKSGDIVSTTDLQGKHLRFRVVDTRIVRFDASGLDPGYGGPTGARLALVTCYPFSGVLNSPLRYVVVAEQML